MLRLYQFSDEACHMVKCSEIRNDEDKEQKGCKDWGNDVHTYEDQLVRDYPSFGQIRKLINERSKWKILIYWD